jgi:hypothetical protein
MQSEREGRRRHNSGANHRRAGSPAALAKASAVEPRAIACFWRPALWGPGAPLGFAPLRPRTAGPHCPRLPRQGAQHGRDEARAPTGACAEPKCTPPLVHANRMAATPAARRGKLPHFACLLAATAAWVELFTGRARPRPASRDRDREAGRTHPGPVARVRRPRPAAGSALAYTGGPQGRRLAARPAARAACVCVTPAHLHLNRG